MHAPTAARRRALAASGALVLVLHALALLPAAPRRHDAAALAPTVARLIDAAPSPVAGGDAVPPASNSVPATAAAGPGAATEEVARAPAGPAPAPPAGKVSPHGGRVTPRAGEVPPRAGELASGADPQAAPAPVAVPGAGPEPGADAAAAPQAVDAASGGTDEGRAGAAAAGDAPATYATRIPPPAQLRWTLRRGEQLGSAELDWSTDADGYVARFVGRLGELAFIEQASRGILAAEGLAPARFTDRRQRRTLAANFRRDLGVVAWSGARGDAALAPGSQDRLSWIPQLAAVAAANPALAAPGGRIVLPVVGARGDASLWVFVGRGVHEDGSVHLARERSGPYDLSVDVWLAPGRHYWPARLRLEPGGDPRARIELEPAAPAR